MFEAVICKILYMSETYGEHRGYCFGEFTLDAERGGLFRNGTRVRLRPKSFDVLRYLVERQGKLVGREELLDAVWAGTVVTDESVTQCLIDIRKALGDRSQTMIRTVPRRGYVFELPVEALGASAVAAPSAPQPKTTSRSTGRSVLAVVAVVAAAVALWVLSGSRTPEKEELPGIDIAADKPSIAVLPFQSMSPDDSRSYFADGVSEEIINSLARQQGLKVIARTSSFSFRGQNVDVGTIASRLDASHVLEGSIRNDGDAFRVSVQLVDARTGSYVWTEQFDRELSATSVFAIQSEIATAVVRYLQTKLSPEEQRRLIRVPTENMGALDVYFEARQLMETRRPKELDRAADLLRSAIDQDPDFALAYVALADTLRLQSNYGSLPWSTADQQGMALIEAAIDIDDGLGEAYASLGNLLGPRGVYPGAEAAFLRGIELSPSYAPLYQWYGQFLWAFVARPQEGVSYSRIAVALDPRSAIINRDYGLALIAAGRYEEALDQYETVIKIDPEFAPIYQDLGELYAGAFGRMADAIPLIERTRSMTPSSQWPTISLAGRIADLGDYEKAAALLDEAHRIAPGDPSAAASKVGLYALTGDSEAALENAETVLAVWPWHVPTLRYLRDRELATRGVDAAIEPYRFSFAGLLGEQSGVVGPSNYAAAIDLAYLLKLNGRHERAEQLLEEARLYIETLPRTMWFGTPLADVRIQAILGNEAEALSLLEAAVDEGWRVAWRWELEHDLALADLREQPEYKAIVKTILEDMERQLQSLIDETAAQTDGVE